jgi:hypothetical protein
MAGKHPFLPGWQNTEPMDQEQFETMVEMGWLDQYGILLDKHLVIDIDPRNGGSESYNQLCRDLDMDFMEISGHYVKTGGGGYHIFFNIPDEFPLLSKLDKYPGVDFKTSGFVVGAGSLHKSGNRYEVVEGYPQDINEAPNKLLALLKRESTLHRINLNNQPIEVDEAELAKMLHVIPSDDYEDWISVGMGLHHATNGVGLDLWDEWSQKSDKYPGYNHLHRKWLGFGKSHNPRTIGSVYHLAEQHGYIPSVTFEASDAIKRQITEDLSNGCQIEKPIDPIDDIGPVEPVAPINFKAIDRLHPPGFVGEVKRYISEQNMRPREWLSVMAALSLVGNIGGLRYKDDLSGVTSNVFFMGVADSGTSKNTVIESCIDMYRRLGIAEAVNGRIKSEQEIINNLMFHQASFYLIDEFGKFLNKITKSGSQSAHYLEGVTGVLMDAYSKAESYFLLSGDQKRKNMENLMAQRKSIKRRLEADDYDTPDLKTKDIIRLETWNRLITEAKNGIKKPFVSITALTTSLGFDQFFSKDTVLDGFMGRCVVFRESDSAPPMNELRNKRPWPDDIVMTISKIFRSTAY